MRHALENVSEVGERLDVIELGGGDESADGGPACAAAVGAREQVVLAPERDGAGSRSRPDCCRGRYDHRRGSGIELSTGTGSSRR